MYQFTVETQSETFFLVYFSVRSAGSDSHVVKDSAIANRLILMYQITDFGQNPPKLLIVDDIIPTKFNFKARLLDGLFIDCPSQGNFP
ncbi:MAG: hypothetical protein QNJ32_14495 [Xenococcaceae cyanobacterium MO_167.B27]|nr:hypothetical protein [Xenococcaceae cyanobacterium MO_167.B27]